MPKLSAGLLMWRIDAAGQRRVLLVHPGGPFWARRDEGAWSIPKGETDGSDDLEAVAAREFSEELGHPVPTGEWIDLGEIRQRSGKRVRAWAVRGDLDTDDIRSNAFEMEWPPRSGRIASFPEVDRAEWMPLDHARSRIITSQAELLDRLDSTLDSEGGSAPLDHG